MTKLTSVNHINNLFFERNIETEKNKRWTDSYVVQLASSIRDLLMDDEVAIVVQFLRYTNKLIYIFSFCDENGKRWNILLSGEGFRKMEHPENIPLNYRGELEYLPHPTYLCPNEFVKLWAHWNGIQDNNVVDDIRKRIISEGEILAEVVMKKKKNADRPVYDLGFFYFIIAVYLICSILNFLYHKSVFL